jgi:hypothetical protein
MMTADMVAGKVNAGIRTAPRTSKAMSASLMPAVQLLVVVMTSSG